MFGWNPGWVAWALSCQWLACNWLQNCLVRQVCFSCPCLVELLELCLGQRMERGNVWLMSFLWLTWGWLDPDMSLFEPMHQNSLILFVWVLPTTIGPQSWFHSRVPSTVTTSASKKTQRLLLMFFFWTETGGVAPYWTFIIKTLYNYKEPSSGLRIRRRKQRKSWKLYKVV